MKTLYFSLNYCIQVPDDVDGNQVKVMLGHGEIRNEHKHGITTTSNFLVELFDEVQQDDK